MQAGKAVVLAFAAIIVAAAALFVAYKVQESRQGPIAMRFERAPAPANATVTELAYKPVHKAPFLQDHLETAALRGNSSETVRLRVEWMRDTLRHLTGSAGPEWWVSWQGAVVHVVLT
jgi:hypothetical protein